MYQLVVYTMIYARKLQKERIKVFVSSLSSHYLHWKNYKEDNAFLLSLEKKTMFLLSLEKKTIFFDVLGKKIVAVLGKENNIFFCCHWKRRTRFLLSLEKKSMFFAVVGKEDNVLAAVEKEENVFCFHYKRRQCFLLLFDYSD